MTRSRRRRRLAALVLLSLPLLGACDDEAVGVQPVAGGVPTFERTVAPFLRSHCTDCHGSRDPDAGLDLTALDSHADAVSRHHLVRTMADYVRHGDMPPSTEERPPAAAQRAFLTWADAIVRRADETLPVDPGRTTARRLTRVEYRNSIRDLLGLDIDAASALPEDAVGYGFDRIGDVLSMPPLLLEKYVELAEEIAARAIVLPGEEHAQTTRVRAADAAKTGKGGPRGDGHWLLFTNGSVAHTFATPRAGEYIVRVGAWAQQAGPDLALMRVVLNNQVLDTVQVKTADADDPGVYERRVRIGRASAELRAEFTNDYYNPRDRDPGNRDRNLAFAWLEIEGPMGPPPREERLAHDRVIFERPRPGGERDAAQVLERVVARLVERAYRRPATEGELRELTEVAAAGTTFEHSVQIALTAVLASPHFLFRVERHPSSGDPADVQPLGPFEMATRLSYFLWSSTPDDPLLTAAAATTLESCVHEHVDRMLADNRADTLVTVFARQWLQLELLDTTTPDPDRFPEWNERFADSARREVEAFVRDVLMNDRDVRDLIDSRHTFVDGRLARHYGLVGVDGDALKRTSWSGTSRGGLLGQVGVLTMTSYPTRTSVVKRGKWVLEALLGAPPPPPPPGVGDLRDDPGSAHAASLRDRMAAHRADPECATCHARLDPLGMAFEGFDAIGRARTHDGRFPVDTTGVLPDGSAFPGPAELRALLRDDPRFPRHLARSLLVFAVGRGPIPDDERAVDRIVARASKAGYRFREFLHAVVDSAPFRVHSGGPTRLEDR